MFVPKMAMKLCIAFLASVVATTIFIDITNQAYSQKKQDSFITLLTLSGVDKSTGDVVSWITVKNLTRSVVYNATDAEEKDKIKDGIVAAALTFPNGTIGVGDEFLACSLVLKDITYICDSGFNTSTSGAEIAYLPIDLAKHIPSSNLQYLLDPNRRY
jgi:hypothetical protein